jgi:hypothetical protein
MYAPQCFDALADYQEVSGEFGPHKWSGAAIPYSASKPLDFNA